MMETIIFCGQTANQLPKFRTMVNSIKMTWKTILILEANARRRNKSSSRWRSSRQGYRSLCYALTGACRAEFRLFYSRSNAPACQSRHGAEWQTSCNINTIKQSSSVWAGRSVMERYSCYNWCWLSSIHDILHTQQIWEPSQGQVLAPFTTWILEQEHLPFVIHP